MRFELGFLKDCTPFTGPEPFEPTLECLRPLAPTVTVVEGDAFLVACDVGGTPCIEGGRLRPLTPESDDALIESLFFYAGAGARLLDIGLKRIDIIPVHDIARVYFTELKRQSVMKPPEIGEHLPIRPEDILMEPVQSVRCRHDMPAEFRDVAEGTLLVIPELQGLYFQATLEQELRRRIAAAINEEFLRWAGKPN